MTVKVESASKSIFRWHLGDGAYLWLVVNFANLYISEKYKFTSKRKVGSQVSRM
jgi:hypothetical protein